MPMTHSFPCRGSVIQIALDPTVGAGKCKKRAGVLSFLMIEQMN
jgi:hypothetical protein